MTSDNCKLNVLPHINLVELSNCVKKEQEDTDTEHRKLFISPVATTLERKPDSSVFVKQEYLLPSEVDGEKFRDDVSRVLHFGESHVVEKSTQRDDKTDVKIETGLENKENANKVGFAVSHGNRVDTVVADVRTKHHDKVSNKKPDKSSGHGHTSIKDHKDSKSSSTSSSRRSSSSSNRDCSKCYKRSKVKKVTTGVQCKRNDPVIVPVIAPKKNANYKRDELKGYKYGQYFHIEVHPVSILLHLSAGFMSCIKILN